MSKLVGARGVCMLAAVAAAEGRSELIRHKTTSSTLCEGLVKERSDVWQLLALGHSYYYNLNRVWT